MLNVGAPDPAAAAEIAMFVPAAASGLPLIATIKGSLVVAYYMHLRYEPRWLALIPLAGLALVAVLVAALTATVAHS